jgi:type II secretory pathway component PulF
MNLQFLNINSGQRQMRRRRMNLLSDIARVLQTDKPDLPAAMRRVADRNAGKAIEQAYRQILSSVKQGKENGLSEALRPYFPEREFLLVKAFDVGAKGDRERGEGFATTVKILRPLAQLRAGFLKLLLSFVVSMAMVGVLWLGFAPSFANILVDLVPREKWFLISKIVTGSADVVLGYWMIGLPLFVGTVAWLVWAMPNWRGATRRWCDRKLPGFVIYREYHSIMTLVGLACFIKANIGFDWAFQQVRRLGTRWESDYIEAIRARSKQYGASKMLDVGYFPDEVIDRIALREGSDSFEASLSSVALQNIDELTAAMTVKLDAARAFIADITKVFGGVVVIAIVLLILAAVQLLTSTTR